MLELLKCMKIIHYLYTAALFHFVHCLLYAALLHFVHMQIKAKWKLEDIQYYF